MFNYTADQIRQFAPAARPEVVQALVDMIDDVHGAGINTPLRWHHFIATLALESRGLRVLEENLTYTTAGRLMQVFPSKFKTAAQAQPYLRNPRKLANLVYGKRLGNKGADDGWKYRGRGLIQTTGLSNYRAAGYEANPDALAEPRDAVKAALFFWSTNRINQEADKDSALGVRRKVNGPAAMDLEEYRRFVSKAKRVFTGAETPEPEKLDRTAKRRLQEKLIELGYVELGTPDGYLGPKTVGAISMFQAENGLEVTGQFDDETVAAIWTAPPRVVQRSTEVPEDSRIIGGSDVLIKASVGTGAIAGGSEVAEQVGLLGHASDAIDKVEEYSGVLGTLRYAVRSLADVGTTIYETVGWQGIAIVAAVFIGVIAWRIRAARIDDHRTGRTA